MKYSHYQATTPAKCVFIALALTALALSQGITANINWTGGGENNLFSNPENWEDEQVPGSGDTIILGDLAPNAAQTINVDVVDLVVGNISFNATEDRNYTLSGNPIQLTATTAVNVLAVASANITIDVNLTLPNGFNLFNQSTTSLATVNGNLSVSGGNNNITGHWRLTGNNSGLGNNQFRLTSGTPAIEAADLVIASTTALTGTRLRISTAFTDTGAPRISLASDATISRGFEFTSNNMVELRVTESGTTDRRLTFTREVIHDATASIGSSIQIVENTPDSSGNLILRFNGTGGTNGVNNIPISTLPGSIIEFNPGGSGVVNLQSYNNAAVGAVISGGGTVVKLNTGTLNVRTINTYTGGTRIENGMVRLMANNIDGNLNGRLPEVGTVAIGQDGILNLNGFDQTIGNLADINGEGGEIQLGEGVLTVGDAADGVFSGDINGTGGIIKQGSGSLTLNGDGGYEGTTLVSAGTLIVNGSLTGGDTITVTEGATLRGTGLLGNNLVLNGSIFAGNSLGELTIEANLSFGANAINVFALGGDGESSQLLFAGEDQILSNAGTLNFLFQPTPDFNTSQTFTLWDFSDATNLDPSGINPLDFQIVNPGWVGIFNLDNDGLHLILAVIPEPGTGTLALLLALGFACLRAKKRCDRK